MKYRVLHDKGKENIYYGMRSFFTETRAKSFAARKKNSLVIQRESDRIIYSSDLENKDYLVVAKQKGRREYTVARESVYEKAIMYKVARAKSSGLEEKIKGLTDGVDPTKKIIVGIEMKLTRGLQ